MNMDDDLGAEEGVSRDGIDDFLDDNYRRATEREADSNVINRIMEESCSYEKPIKASCKKRHRSSNRSEVN